MATMNNRRRAERFAQLLDEAGGGRRHHRRTPHDAELTALLALGQELAERDPAPEIDPEFRTGLRAMLVATAEREGIGVAATPAPAQAATPDRHGQIFSKGPRARTAAIAGVAIGAVAFAGMSTASESAVPGDALYGVKRSTERAQLALASSELGRGQLYLSFAQTRAREAQLLSDDLERVLEDMDRDTSQGVRLLSSAAANRHDRAALDVIESFVGEQRTTLDRLAGEVDRDDAERVAASLSLLEAISARADELRRSLVASCTSVASVDELGPVPADCVALPAPPTLDLSEPATTARQPAPEARTGAPTRGRPADAEPTPMPAGTRFADQPPATGEPTPTPSSTAEEGPAEAPHDGIVDGLNRLLGNLLGG